MAGGRGKGHFSKYPKGGVQLLFSAGTEIHKKNHYIAINWWFIYKFTIVFLDEVEAAAKGMIGDYLITKQTGAEGRICNSVMVTERKYTRKEYYLAFMNDRKFNVSFILVI